MAQLNFRPSEVPQDEFHVLPEGEYMAEIIKSEITPNKANTGQILKLTWSVKSGQRAGVQIWQNLNIVNANAQAQGIAERELANICEAARIDPLHDSEQLHHIPLLIGVKIRPAQNGYKPQNEIKGVRPMSAPQAAQPQQHAAPATQPQQAYAPPAAAPAPIGGGARPWG